MLPAGSAGVGHSNEETWRNAGSLGEAVIYVAVAHTKRHTIDTKRSNLRRLFVFFVVSFPRVSFYVDQ